MNESRAVEYILASADASCRKRLRVGCRSRRSGIDRLSVEIDGCSFILGFFPADGYDSDRYYHALDDFRVALEGPLPLSERDEARLRVYLDELARRNKALRRYWRRKLELKTADAPWIEEIGRKLDVDVESLALRREPLPEGQGETVSKRRILLISRGYRRALMGRLTSLLRRFSPSLHVHLLADERDVVCDRTLRSHGLVVVSQDVVMRTEYDEIVSFGGAEFIDQNPLAGRTIFLLTAHDFHYFTQSGSSSLGGRLSGPGYHLLQDAFPRERIPASITLRGAVGWPPDVDVDYSTGDAAPVFNYLVLGGKDRDYRPIYENRALFKGKKVLLTRCDSVDADQAEYISRLREEPNFACLDLVDLALYAKLLIYSETCIAFFKGQVPTDHTSLSDALWYGKPVVTNLVDANRHLEPFLSIVNGGRKDLAANLRRLDDPRVYARLSAAARDFCRAHGDFSTVLRDLADLMGRHSPSSPVS